MPVLDGGRLIAGRGALGDDTGRRTVGAGVGNNQPKNDVRVRCPAEREMPYLITEFERQRGRHQARLGTVAVPPEPAMTYPGSAGFITCEQGVMSRRGSQ